MKEEISAVADGERPLEDLDGSELGEIARWWKIDPNIGRSEVITALRRAFAKEAQTQLQRQSRATAGDQDLQDAIAPDLDARAAPRSRS